MTDLKSKKLFLLDMDGTIYLDNDVFDGTMDFLKKIKDKNNRYLFLTNNSSKSAKDYVRKLKNIGIDAVENIEGSENLVALAKYLAKRSY